MSLFDELNDQNDDEGNDPYDMTKVINIMATEEWLNASPQERSDLIPDAMDLMLSQFEEDKNRTVSYHLPNGELKDIPAYIGGVQTKGLSEHLSKARKVLFHAAQDEDGGLHTNSRTGRTTASQRYRDMSSAEYEAPIDILSDFTPWRAETDTIVDEGLDKKVFGEWHKFVDWANSNNKNGEADIDVNDKGLESEWKRRNVVHLFDSTSLDDKMVGVVGNEVIFNEDKMEEAWNVEAGLKASGKSAFEQKMILNSYKEMLSAGFGGYIKSSAGAFDFTGIRERANAAMAKPDFDAFEYMKANREDFDNGENWLPKELLETFRDGVMAFGSGTNFLIGRGLEKMSFKNPASDFLVQSSEAWGWAAAADADKYNDQELFSFGSEITFNRRDFTNLAGQVGSFGAVGGLGKVMATTRVAIAARYGRCSSIGRSHDGRKLCGTSSSTSESCIRSRLLNTRCNTCEKRKGSASTAG